jgi:non-canonical purine NTP pyrophosphatase (RdgB/HAM1 family)
MPLSIATSNPNKLREIRALLGQPIEQVEIDLAEVQAVDVEVVIEQKARQAFRLLGRPVLVEDTGLAIQAWNGLPGALVRWFLKTVGPDGICRMLEGFPDRSATAKTCLGLFDGTSARIFAGQVEGKIAPHPRGERGFGWDAIFIPDGSRQTFAEMSAAEKGAISMRMKAVEQLKAYLEEDS